MRFLHWTRRRSRVWQSGVALGLALLGEARFCSAGPYINLGDSDALALDQPQVAVEVISTAGTKSFGPDLSNTYLLDTGSSGILHGDNATSELAFSGYQTVVKYDETGVAGVSPLDVSVPYRLDFAGTNGIRQTLNPVRMLSSTDLNLGGFGGIVGMPGMRGRVVRIDMRGWSDGSSTNLKTDFPATVAAQSHQYKVPLTMVDFPASGQRQPSDPLPTFEALPFVPVTAQHGATRIAGRFLMDTGAQQSILSSSLAFALGLDRNGNGTLEDEAVGTIPIGGIGGSIEILEMEIDGLLLGTSGGVDLRWNHLTVGVVDIDPQISGVFGMDLLTSGWFTKVLLGFGDDGILSEVDFDFRAGVEPAMYLTINSQLDHVIVPEPASLLLAVVGCVGVAWALRRARQN